MNNMIHIAESIINCTYSMIVLINGITIFMDHEYINLGRPLGHVVLQVQMKP